MSEARENAKGNVLKRVQANKRNDIVVKVRPKHSKFGLTPLHRNLADSLSPHAVLQNMGLPSGDIAQTYAVWGN